MEGQSLDVSNRGVKKLEKGLIPMGQMADEIKVLNLNGNSLQRLDNIDVFHSLQELHANRNQIVRMYHISKLRNLVHLDLSSNHVLTIEGLKELRSLKVLNLSHNNIKLMDASHLQTNTKLEYIDLSHNSISYITNISDLTALKTLFLHNNQICTLRHCELYLPICLDVLTLSDNCISDLNEFSHLVQLYNLQDLSVAGNPCLSMTCGNLGFDYRPFILNWCLSLKSIDGYVVDDLERLKAEWLYSQGKGRKFRSGEHSALVRYLAETCPMTSRHLECDQERKLRVILTKAQQYQRQVFNQEPLDNVSCASVELAKRSRRPSTTSRLMSRSFDPSLVGGGRAAMRRRNDSDANGLFLQKEKVMSRSIHCGESSSRSSSERSCSVMSRHPNATIKARTLPRCYSSQVGQKPNPLPCTRTLLPAPDYILKCGVSALDKIFPATSTPKVCKNELSSFMWSKASDDSTPNSKESAKKTFDPVECEKKTVKPSKRSLKTAVNKNTQPSGHVRGINKE